MNAKEGADTQLDTYRVPSMPVSFIRIVPLSDFPQFSICARCRWTIESFSGSAELSRAFSDGLCVGNTLPNCPPKIAVYPLLADSCIPLPSRIDIRGVSLP